MSGPNWPFSLFGKRVKQKLSVIRGSQIICMFDIPERKRGSVLRGGPSGYVACIRTTVFCSNNIISGKNSIIEHPKDKVVKDLNCIVVSKRFSDAGNQ